MNPLHDLIQALANKTGIKLPDSYFTFLSGLETGSSSGAVQRLRFGPDDKEWQPYTANALLKPFRLNRGDPVVQAHETRAHAAFLREFDDPFLLADLDKAGFDLDRLARGFCVGSNDAGDPIFVDSDTKAVFIYRHDDTAVQRWADDLSTFMLQSHV
jgi:hypothetical protein